jgi:hypothetical protein
MGSTVAQVWVKVPRESGVVTMVTSHCPFSPMLTGATFASISEVLMSAMLELLALRD